MAHHLHLTDSERGSGLFSTLFGVIAILIFFFFAAQISLGLYAKSIATAVGQDLARDIAVLGPKPSGAEVENLRVQAQNQGHGMGLRLTVDQTSNGCAPAEFVCIHVKATPPQLLGSAPGIAIDRIVRVRVEKVVT